MWWLTQSRTSFTRTALLCTTRTGMGMGMGMGIVRSVGRRMLHRHPPANSVSVKLAITTTQIQLLALAVLLPRAMLPRIPTTVATTVTTTAITTVVVATRVTTILTTRSRTDPHMQVRAHVFIHAFVTPQKCASLLLH